MSKDLVSVVMNCHNSDEFLNEALNSLLKQTYKNIEIIFWDNNSTDTSAEIAKSYGNKIKYFHVSETLSLGEARHEAVKVCKGKYLAFLDCDDIWYEDKIAKQIDIISSDSKIGFVYGRTHIFHQKIKQLSILGNEGPLLEGDIFHELLKTDFIPFPSALIDIKKFWQVGGFPIHFYNSPDYWIFLHLAQKYEVRAIQEPCCMYRVHGNNLTKKQLILSALESIEVVESFLPLQAASVGLKQHKVTLALSYFRSNNYIIFLKMLREISISILFQRLVKKLIKGKVKIVT